MWRDDSSHTLFSDKNSVIKFVYHVMHVLLQRRDYNNTLLYVDFDRATGKVETNFWVLLLNEFLLEFLHLWEFFIDMRLQEIKGGKNRDKISTSQGLDESSMYTNKDMMNEYTQAIITDAIPNWLSFL